MELTDKVVYEAPSTTVVEIKMEGGILTMSDPTRDSYGDAYELD